MAAWTVRYQLEDGAIRDGHIIAHQDKLWLVPEWLYGPTANKRCPARIICTDDLGLLRAPAESHLDYFLETPLNKDVLEGRRVTQTPYVIPRPDIILSLDSDFHRG
jgi:hypothetical protein